MTPFTDASVASSVKAASSSSMVALESAFFTSGRNTFTTATSPSRSTWVKARKGAKLFFSMDTGTSNPGFLAA